MAATFLYEAAVVELHAATPAAGPAAGGTAVVILGRGFQVGAAVTVGGGAATGVSVPSSERIECTTPAHALGVVDVVVTNPDASTATLLGGFTYQTAAPAGTVTTYRSPGGAGVARVRLQNSALKIHQVLGQPSTLTFTADEEPAGWQPARVVVQGVELFQGTVQRTTIRLEGKERRPAWDVETLDQTALLRRAYPSGAWVDVAADTILGSLLATDAPAFSAAGVEAGLPPVTLLLNGTRDLWAIITDVCNKCGAKAFLDGLTLHVFTVDSGLDSPALVTESNPDLLYPESGQAVTLTLDYTGIRNRVTVYGAAGVRATLDHPVSISRFGVCPAPVTDNTLTTVAECLARAQVELDGWALEIPVVRYATRDLKTRVGKTVPIAMTEPPVSGDWIIQAVEIDQLELLESSPTKPRFLVTAVPPSVPMRRTGSAVALLQGVIDLQVQAGQSPKLDGDVTSDAGGRTTIPPGTITAAQLAGCIPPDALTQAPVKGPADAATTANVTLSGAQTIDGVALVAGDRVLVKNQTLGAENGLYVVAAGAWVRTADAGTSAELVPGAIVFVAGGSAHGGQWFGLATPGPITLGTTVLDFVPLGVTGVIKADGSVDFAADQSLGGFALTDVADPVDPQDAATKAYVDAAGGGLSVPETPGGAVNGSNTHFTTAAAYPAGTLRVYLNGLRLLAADVTETGASTFDLTTAPLTGDGLLVEYGGGGGGGGAGALVLLESHTASASASLDFTTRNATGQSGATFQSDFDEYVIEAINLIPATDNVDFLLRVSTDGGSSYDSGANYGRALRLDSASFNVVLGANSGLTALIAVANVDTTTTQASLNLSIRLFNPLSAANYKAATVQGTFKNNDANYYAVTGSGWYLSATAVNAFRCAFSSGNITSGTVRVYGVAK